MISNKGQNNSIIGSSASITINLLAIFIIVLLILLSVHAQSLYKFRRSRGLRWSHIYYSAFNIIAMHEAQGKYPTFQGKNEFKNWINCGNIEITNCKKSEGLTEEYFYRFKDWYYSSSDGRKFMLIIILSMRYESKSTVVKIDQNGIWWRDSYADDTISAKDINPSDINCLVSSRTNKKDGYFTLPNWKKCDNYVDYIIP